MITVRLMKRPDGSAAVGPPRVIDAAGMTIGRALDCQLVLDDPLRGVSRQHAWLAPQPGGESALLRCISSTAALAVNGAALAPGAERLVRAGDVLRIGGFELKVEGSELTTIPVQSNPPPRAAAVPPPPPPVAAVAPRAMTAAAPASYAAPRPSPQRQRSRLDEMFELDTAADPLGPGSPLPTLDGTSTNLRPIAAVPARAPTPMPAPAIAPAPMQRATPIVKAALATLPKLAPIPIETATPRVAETPRADPPPAYAESAAPLVADAEALRQAFLRGAGLPDGPATSGVTIDAQWMAHAGALLRAATDGTLALLRSRAVAKRSIRAEGTRIAAKENNPLKFAPDGAEALTQLLKVHSARGFLEPIDAMNDAHNDLQVHQLAMVAGMRAAVFELISRLGPAALEASLPPSGGLARLFPDARDAALWRKHREQHAHLLDHLDDDFETVFGREFVRAYEEQARLAAAAALSRGET